MLRPAVYEIKEEEGNRKSYYLNEKIDLFSLPNKIYGGLDGYAVRFWKTFAMSRGSMGILLTGASGSGKTALSMMVSNLAISNNMAVVLVSDIQATIELVKFIDNLSGVVIVFDEFGKSFNLNLQDKMLTMFSNLNNSKKLFIITENEVRDISRYIRNRPGRAKYHLDFTRITEELLEEYCNDYPIKDNFLKELKELHKRSTVFSFDHLQALIGEHVSYPDDDFSNILNILNLDILTQPSKLTLISAHDVKEDKVVEVKGNNSMEREDFDRGRIFYINTEDYKTIKVDQHSVTSITDDIIECLVDDTYKVILRIE